MSFLQVGKLSVGRYLKGLLGLTADPLASIHPKPNIVPVVDLTEEISPPEYVSCAGTPVNATLVVMAWSPTAAVVPENERWEIVSAALFDDVALTGTALGVCTFLCCEIVDGTTAVSYNWSCGGAAVAGGVNLTEQLKGIQLRQGMTFRVGVLAKNAASFIYINLWVRKYKM